MAALVVALFDYDRHIWWPSVLHAWPASLMMLAAVFVVGWAMVWLLRRLFEQEKAR